MVSVEVENQRFAGNNLFEKLFNANSDGVLLVSDDFLIEAANPRICKVTDYQGFELLGKPLEDLISPLDLNADFKQKLLQGDNQQVRFFKKNKNVFWGWISLISIDSGLKRRLIIVQDISEAEICANVLQAMALTTSAKYSNSFFETFVLNLTCSLGVKVGFLIGSQGGESGNFLYKNNRMVYLNQKNEEIDIDETFEITAKVFCLDRTIIPDFKYVLHNTPCVEVIKSGKFFVDGHLHNLYPHVSLYQKYDLQYFYGEALYGSDNSIIGWMGVMDDKAFKSPKLIESIFKIYSARLAAELEVEEHKEKLKNSQEYLRRIIDLIPNVIFSLNEKGDFAIANKAASELFTNRNIDQLVKKTSLNTQDEEQGFHKNVLRKLKDSRGKARWYTMTKTPVSSRDGKIEEVLVTATDVTSRIAIEKKLKERNQILKKINQELDHFVYRASHDLRAPLTSILGLVNLLQTNEESDDKVKYLNHLRNQVNRLDLYIKEIVDYSKITRVKPVLEEIDFETMIHDVFNDLKFIPNVQNIHKDIKFINRSRFFSDRKNIVIILNNLLSNAIKYADVRKEFPFVIVELDISDTTAKISIKDNGIGIDELYLPRVFEMFFRATESGAGSGLGLFIVKEAIDRLQGHITVQSQKGTGSEFIVEIPNKIATN